MANLHTYAGKTLLSAEKASLDLKRPDSKHENALSSDDSSALCKWLSETLPLVSSASISTRLVDSPAIIVGHESAAMRRMMGMMEAGRAPELTPQVRVEGGIMTRSAGSYG